MLLSVRPRARRPPRTPHSRRASALMTAKQLRRSRGQVPGGRNADPEQRPRPGTSWRRRTGKPKSAIARVPAYRRYMDLVPNMPDPYYGLGLCLFKTGDKPGALASLKHFVAVAPRPKSKVWIEHAASVIEELTAPPDAPATPGRTGAAKPAAAVARERGVRRGAAAARPRTHRRIDREVQAGDRRRSEAHRPRAPRWASCCSRSVATTRQSRSCARPSTRIRPTRSRGTTWRSRCACAASTWRRSTPTSTTSSCKPGDPDPYYGLGRSLQHLGRASDARHAFETYLSLEKRPTEQRWVESAEAQLKTLAAAK